MNRRLQQLLDAENITQAQFADSIGVARASVSHILAGRNKPGFDFIESVARNFPDVNLKWLISGTGKMYEKPSLPTQEALSPTPNIQSATLPADDPVTNVEQEQSAIAATETAQIQDQPENCNSLFPTESTDNQDDTKITTSQETRIPDQPLPAPRKIAKIIVMYTDGTFQEIG